MRLSVLFLALSAALPFAPTATADTLPTCDEISTWDEGTRKDCRTESTDGSGLVFEGHTTGTDNDQTPFRVSVDVLSSDGKHLETITEDAYRQCGNGYFLRDLDHDGRDEVLIITACGGTGGDTLAVWRATGDSHHFERAGEMFGFLNFWRTDDGLIGQYAHSSAASGVVSLYEFAGNRLVKVAALETETADYPQTDAPRNWVVTGNTKCALSVDDGLPLLNRLRAHRIDPNSAQQHLCAQLGDFYATR